MLAVGSTGRMQADGRLALTGGGDIELRVGGALNPALPTPYESSGSVTNLRGQTSLQAASFGRLDPLYGVKAARDTRALDLFRAADVVTTGGIALYAGDSAFRLRSLGDLAIEKPTIRAAPHAAVHALCPGKWHAGRVRRQYLVLAVDREHRHRPVFGRRQPDAHHAGDAAERQRRDLPVAVVGRGRQRQHLLQDPVLLAPGPPAAWTCWRAIRSTAATRRSCAAAHRWTRWPRPTAPPSSAW